MIPQDSIAARKKATEELIKQGVLKKIPAKEPCKGCKPTTPAPKPKDG